MQGELGLKALKAVITPETDAIRPFSNFAGDGGKVSLELKLLDENGAFLYLVGENDWAELMVDALIPLEKEACKVENQMLDTLADLKYRPQVIGLGKDEFRLLNLFHRIKGSGDPILIYRGIPIVKLGENSAIKFYREANSVSLPRN